MAELIRKQTGDLVTLHSPQLEMFPGLRHAYFTRHGGVSQGVYESMNFRFAGTDSRENVLENHRIAAAFLGGDGDRLARTTQMHTDNIVVVEDVAEPVKDVAVALEAAPIRCCRSSAMRIVVLSIADFGKYSNVIVIASLLFSKPFCI